MAFGKLTVYHPDGRQEDVDLAKPTVRLGRAQDNDIVLQHDTVSSYHAQILCDNDGCQVLDLGSANGTYLVGERIEPQVPHLIGDGALLQIGSAALTYHAPPRAALVPVPDATSRTARLPVGSAPPLPPGVPASAPATNQSAAPPPIPTGSKQEATMRMPVGAIPADPPAPAAASPQAAPGQGSDATMRMPIVDQTPTPNTAASQPVPETWGAPLSVTPSQTDAPPLLAASRAASVQPPLPRRGWGQAPPPITSPSASTPRRRSAWLVAGGIIALLAFVAAGVWLVLPLMAGSASNDQRQSSAPAAASANENEPTNPRATGAPSAQAQDQVYEVVTQGGVNLRVRREPNGEIIGSLPNGAIIRVVEGPVRSGEFEWVRIEGKTSDGTDLTGWCAFAALQKR